MPYTLCILLNDCINPSRLLHPEIYWLFTQQVYHMPWDFQSECFVLQSLGILALCEMFTLVLGPFSLECLPYWTLSSVILSMSNNQYKILACFLPVGMEEAMRESSSFRTLMIPSSIQSV